MRRSVKCLWVALILDLLVTIAVVFTAYHVGRWEAWLDQPITQGTDSVIVHRPRR